MRAILADNDIQGQFRMLLQMLQSNRWREVWLSLNLGIRTFEDLGLTRDVSDAVLWHACQQFEVLLVTGNRNEDGPDSLETTIRSLNTPHSLPVFTLADTEQVLHSKAYAERVVERLLDYLLELDNYRGTGRLYLP
jgi:hypothetical protein